MNALIDRLVSIADRHSKLLGGLGAVSLALSCASYAGFIKLPKFEILSGPAAMIASVIYNAVWWGFVYPNIDENRKLRAAEREGAKNHG
jgi:hypothetical protein